MDAITFGEFVTKHLEEYYHASVARNECWFAIEINQRAYLDFQMQVMAMWLREQERVQERAAKTPLVA